MSDLAFSLESLPEDIRGEPSLKDFKTWPDIAKSFVNVSKLVGVDKNHVLRIPTDGDISKMGDLWKLLGKPEKYEYPADLKTILPDDYKVKLTAFADKHNFTKTQFEELLHFTDGETQAMLTAGQTAREQQKQAAAQAVKDAFGASYDQTLNFAKNVPELFGKASLWDKFEKAGLTSDPEFLGFMGDLGRMAGEDSFVNGNGGKGFNLSPASAESEINGLMADPTFAKRYYGRDEPGHKEAVDKVYKLRQIAIPE